MTVKIVTDSTSDLSQDLADSLGITVVPCTVQFDTESYRDRIDLTTDEFYHKLQNSRVFPTTSQPSVGDFLSAYEAPLTNGDQVVSVHVSGKLSGTVNAALLAREQLRQVENIVVIDSQMASMALGLIAIGAADVAQDGASLDAVRANVINATARTRVALLFETLEYLQRGGRIGKAQALVGSLLNLKPLLHLEEGEVHPLDRVRTRRKGVERLIKFVETATPLRTLAVISSTDPDQAAELLESLKELAPSDRQFMAQLGPALGAHAGPGALGVAFQW